MNILDKIEENAKQNPIRKAICLGGIHPSAMSWEKLSTYSNKLASYLDRSLCTKKPLIVYGHKNPYMLVCFLACVKSGRAYCPIDTSVPLSRVEAIIGEVMPEVILTTENLSLQYSNLLSLNAISSIIENEKNSIDKSKFVSEQDVFYIIFTSGSTGTPKGVQITRDNLDNFIQWALTLGNGFDEAEHHVFLNQAPFSFDLSVMDLYLSLYTGGTLWALDKETQGDMKALLQSLEESKSSVWVSTPSFVDVCLSDNKFSQKILPDLKTFLFCGEILTNQTAERLNLAFPNALIVNTYGPTESTVAVTEIIVNSEVREKWNPLPVGRAKKGTWILIMDEYGNVLPDGEKGEIIIVGDTVSCGYWNKQELTDKVFGSYDINGIPYRLYHTGDKGYKEEGQLFYCGRIDLQIKLHGYRIELEDIESNIMKIENVRKVAVLPVYRNDQIRSLTAYIVYENRTGTDFDNAQRLRIELKEYLPDYMIPKKIVFINNMPMTSNGKIDRKALGGNIS